MSSYVPVQMPHRGYVPHGVRFRIPRWIHDKAMVEYARQYRGDNDIAGRGGFGLEELIVLLAGGKFSDLKDGDWPQATDFFNRWPEDAEGTK